MPFVRVTSVGFCFVFNFLWQAETSPRGQLAKYASGAFVGTIVLCSVTTYICYGLRKVPPRTVSIFSKFFVLVVLTPRCLLIYLLGLPLGRLTIPKNIVCSFVV